MLEHWGSDVTRLEVSGQRSSPGNILRDVADRSGGGRRLGRGSAETSGSSGSGVKGRGSGGPGAGERGTREGATVGSGSRPRAVSPVLSWEGARELSRSPERVWIEAWTSDISSRTVASSRWQGRGCEEQEQILEE